MNNRYKEALVGPDVDDYLAQLPKHELDKTGIYRLLQIYVLPCALLVFCPHCRPAADSMNLRLSPTTMPLAIRPGGVAGPSARTSGTGGGFADALSGALSSVSAAQNEAARLQREVQLENPKVSLEETMVAIQKAQIGFQATLHVRNRMVQAYTDIMNMQV